MATRRSFLRGVIAAALAPAIVRAESLMPIYVPPPPKIITPESFNLGDGDWTVDGWVSDVRFTKKLYEPNYVEPVFRHVAFVVSGGVVTNYVDGKQVAADHPLVPKFHKVAVPTARERNLPTDLNGLIVDEVRISSINRMKELSQ